VPAFARTRLVAALAVALLPACTSSKTLDAKERRVEPALETVAWSPATRDDVLGYFESERVTGDAASSVRKVYYSFAADGTYTGAALVQEGSRATFQTLSGRWTLASGSLTLGDDAPPAKAFASPGRLRIDSAGGAAFFRRGTLE
jgi:hypothetical protein